MYPSVRLSSRSDASAFLGDQFDKDRRERPADTERNYDKWNFSDSCGSVNR